MAGQQATDAAGDQLTGLQKAQILGHLRHGVIMNIP